MVNDQVDVLLIMLSCIVVCHGVVVLSLCSSSFWSVIDCLLFLISLDWFCVVFCFFVVCFMFVFNVFRLNVMIVVMIVVMIDVELSVI